ncbi:MAG: hypothetical protein V1739_05795 [Candidatus Omnitrophota bacterium]
MFRLRSALMVSVVEPSDVATTSGYYVDVFPEDLEEAAEMLAESNLVQFLGVIRTAHFCYCKENTNL